MAISDYLAALVGLIEHLRALEDRGNPEEGAIQEVLFQVFMTSWRALREIQGDPDPQEISIQPLGELKSCQKCKMEGPMERWVLCEECLKEISSWKQSLEELLQTQELFRLHGVDPNFRTSREPKS